MLDEREPLRVALQPAGLAVTVDAPVAEAAQRPPSQVELVRALGVRDSALLTVGSILGTGIFLTTGDMARTLPHAELLLLVWLAGGLLTLAGALTFGELGALFPRAGGQYQYLKEGYGTLAGFLYGWAAFFVIFGGGVAAIAVGFAEYLGTFLPFLSGENVLAAPFGENGWTLSGRSVAAVVAIVVLTAVNALGLREGANVQNALTVLKLALVVGLGLVGFVAADRGADPAVLVPQTGLLAAFGVAMIGALWAYDGWNNAAMVAGEMRDPGRTLPRGLFIGTATITALYLLLNAFYLRALPMSEVAGAPRIAEGAAAAVFGSTGARFVSATIVLSAFGCLSANILAGARIYLAMARDGVFFRWLADVHPIRRVPARSLWLQAAVAVVFAVSGSYEQLYTYVTFAVVLFQAAAGAAIFVLRRARPELPRPYRAWGYPWVPMLFVLASLALVVNTLLERPLESLLGLAFLAVGLPAYAMWRRGAPPVRPSTASTT